MTQPADRVVRRAAPADAASVGRLMHDFNAEYDEYTPGPRKLAQRFGTLLADGQTAAPARTTSRRGPCTRASASPTARAGRTGR